MQAGKWFGAQLKQMVTNAYPPLISGGGTGTGSVTVTSPGNQTSTVNTAVSLQITATDTAGGTPSYSATGLPAGLSINASTGLVSGTPTAAGTSTVTVTARDTSNSAGTASFTWTVTPSGGGGSGGCTATYAIGNSWSTGFTANVTVTNTGSAAIQSWKVTWTWAGNQQVTNAWNATESHSGQNETVSNAAYNGAIAAGGNTTFGFQASYSGTNTNPTLTCTAS